MADIIHDDEQNDNHMANNGFDQLDSLKRQMELRGSELGKTWSELSRIMTQYQTQLIQKHETYKSNLSSDDQMRVAKLESMIEKKALQVQKLEKSNSDLESRLLEKDSEIVRLRTEVHQSRNEVSMKDALIEKLQSQMAKEAIEYQTELNSLKEMLQMGSEAVDSPGATSKRRRVTPQKTAATATTASTSSIVKQESSLQSIRLPTTTQQAFITSTPDTSLVAEETGLEMEAYSNPENEDENYYKLDEVGDDSLQGSEYGLGEDEQGSNLDSGQDLGQDITSQYAVLPRLPGQRLATTDQLRSVHYQAETEGRRPRRGGAVQQESPVTLSNATRHPTTVHYQAEMEKRRIGTPLADRPVHHVHPVDSQHQRKETQQCPVCGKTLSRTGAYILNRHLRSHYRIKPYVCSICSAAFGEKSRVIYHLKTRHFDLVLGKDHETFVITDEAEEARSRLTDDTSLALNSFNEIVHNLDP